MHGFLSIASRIGCVWKERKDVYFFQDDMRTRNEGLEGWGFWMRIADFVGSSTKLRGAGSKAAMGGAKVRSNFQFRKLTEFRRNEKTETGGGKKKSKGDERNGENITNVYREERTDNDANDSKTRIALSTIRLALWRNRKNETNIVAIQCKTHGE